MEFSPALKTMVSVVGLCAITGGVILHSQHVADTEEAQNAENYRRETQEHEAQDAKLHAAQAPAILEEFQKAVDDFKARSMATLKDPLKITVGRYGNEKAVVISPSNGEEFLFCEIFGGRNNAEVALHPDNFSPEAMKCSLRDDSKIPAMRNYTTKGGAEERNVSYYESGESKSGVVRYGRAEIGYNKGVKNHGGIDDQNPTCVLGSSLYGAYGADTISVGGNMPNNEPCDKADKILESALTEIADAVNRAKAGK